MKLDRQELHVLRELKARYYLPVNKFANAIAAKQISVHYCQGLDKTECTISNQESLSAFVGMSFVNKKEPKVSLRIGRMIAFARAVVNWYNAVRYNGENSCVISGNDLEKIARGIN